MGKKFSKSKKALLSRLYYQNAKRKKLVTEISKYRDVNSKSKILFEGKKRTNNTIRNILLNRSKDINNKISEIESKIKNYTFTENQKKIDRKYKRKGHKPGDIDLPIGHIWHRKDFDQYINRKRIKRVRYLNESEYISKDLQYTEIYTLADNTFMGMDSFDTIHIREHFPTGDLEFYVIRRNKTKNVVIDSLSEVEKMRQLDKERNKSKKKK